ncbi:transporter substrate-binding domain-containing protein [Chitinibacter sp. GC72]|uniref:transporter substrate-binding domain-containing protein n=1 Tax=Chitinibacter sp. GC72 TaxID=1526917 RepID=UPI0012F79B0B|nr:transporter substrate-binding domain-containing protein [Chitinibacter sp. GC72]
MKLFLPLLVLIISGMLSVNTQAQEPLKIAIVANRQAIIDSKILEQVYQRVGIRMKLLVMPGLRASQEADLGLIDSEVIRIGSYLDAHPQMIRIEPAIDTAIVAAIFKPKLKGQINSLADLKNLKKYKIGYVRGIKAVHDLIGNLPNAQSTNTPKALMKMFQADRLDIIVETVGSSNFYIKKLGLQELEQVELSRQPLYHYLHKKNRTQATLIENELKRLVSSGELLKIRARAEADFEQHEVDPF